MANLLIIKDLLKQKNITIKDFAMDLGMSEQGLQKLIRENSTKIETLETIAEKLKVSISIFFDSEKDREVDFEDSFNELHFEHRAIDALSKAVNILASINEKLVLENDELKDRLKK